MNTIETRKLEYKEALNLYKRLKINNLYLIIVSVMMGLIISFVNLIICINIYIPYNNIFLSSTETKILSLLIYIIAAFGIAFMLFTFTMRKENRTVKEKLEKAKNNLRKAIREERIESISRFYDKRSKVQIALDSLNSYLCSLEENNEEKEKKDFYAEECVKEYTEYAKYIINSKYKA